MPAEWDSHWNTKGINHDIMKIWAGYFVDSYQNYFGLLENDVVLDFGAGLGDVSFLIKDKVQRIYLFDKSKYFLEELEKRFERFENVQVVDSLQEITEPASLIIINGVIHYMNEKGSTASVMQKPESLFPILCPRVIPNLLTAFPNY
jgi:SAM-dependent methyltransferase